MAHYDDDMMADLATMDDEFVDVEPAERKGSNNVPGGNYQATIDKLFFDRTKDGTKILLKWELLVAAGDFKGERLTRNNMTSTPDNLRWLKADLLAAGLDVEGMRLTQVAEVLDQLLDVMVEVSVKHQGSGDDARTNIYVNRRVELDRSDSRTDPPARGSGSAQRSQPTRSERPAASERTSRPAAGGSGSGGASRGLQKF